MRLIAIGGFLFNCIYTNRRRNRTDYRLTNQFGRILAYVYTANGASIDEALIREGVATAWTRDGQHRGYLVGLEREARRKDAGVSLVSP